MRAVWLIATMATLYACPAAGNELADAIQAARGEFRPVTEGDVAAAAARLHSAKAELERFLARDPRRASAWSEYLNFAVLDEELARALESDLTVLDRDVLARARLAPWVFGGISHAVWSLAFVLLLTALALGLSLRAYRLTWETTLLTPDFFVRFVQATAMRERRTMKAVAQLVIDGERAP